MKKLAILIAVLMALVIVGVAYAQAMTVCHNVYYKNVKIAKVCVVWNIQWRAEPKDVKALGNGTRSITWYKSGYTAVGKALWCQPLKVWTDEVHCRSRVNFYEKGFYIGKIIYNCYYRDWSPGGQYCVFDASHD